MSLNQEHKRTIRALTKSAVFAALIFLSTTYLSFPLPVMGYIHPGDGIILLAAALLPMPYSLGAAVIGAGLADLAAGFPMYIPATIVIKAATVALISYRTKKVVAPRNLTALLPVILVCAGGYYLYEVIITKSLVVPLASVPLNLAQSLCGAVIFVVFGLIIDNSRGISKIFK